MREKEYFTRSINVNITAATIGINKEDWYCFKPGMKQQDVIKTMLNKKFDVVPIFNKQGTFNSYYTLNKLDNSKLDFNNIEPGDRLYYLTHIMDAVWRMNKSKKTHFFLSNGHDENDIVGLLSLSNYNSREFYVYLFSIISYIEREFAALIESDKTKGFEILEKMSNTEETKEQLKTIQGRYAEDEKNGNENDYKEYLYLFQLKCLIIDEQKFKELDYRNSQDFESGIGKLKDLRNNIAHPVKSIVRNLNDLNNLEIGMNKLYELKERLDKHILIDTEIS
jgi:hypothetical protein